MPMSTEPGEAKPLGNGVQLSVAEQTTTFAPNCSQPFPRIGLCYIIRGAEIRHGFEPMKALDTATPTARLSSAV